VSHEHRSEKLKEAFAGRPREPHGGRRGVSPRFKARVEAHRWKGKKALDIGCGTGAGTLLLASLGADAVGMDIDAAILLEAAERAREDGTKNARFVCADAELADFEEVAMAPDGLDGVLAHLCFSKELARRAADALKPGGVLIVRSFHKDMWKEAGGGSPFAFTEPEMRQLLASLGLQVRHLEVERRTQTFESIEAFEEAMLWDAGRHAHWQEDGRLDTLRRAFARGEHSLTEAFLVVEARKPSPERRRPKPRKRPVK